MTTMTISLPDAMKDWIETQIGKGEYASSSDYVRDLVRRDRARRGREITLEDLRRRLAESKASGAGERTVDDIFAEAEAIARARGLLNE